MYRFNKKRFTMRQVVGLLTVVFLGIAVIAYAVNIPNSFTSGNPIRSSEVNANFNAVKNAVDALEAGPNVIALEDRPGVISVPTLWANSTPVCTTADYTPPRNQRALINADMSFASSAQQTFNIWPAYSNDSGTNWVNIVSWAPHASNPANGWMTVPFSHSLDLTAGTSYRFSIKYQAENAFTTTNSHCHIRVVIVNR